MQTWRRHERSPLASPQPTDRQSTMTTAQARACTILVAFERARTELVGEAVTLSNGKAGIVSGFGLMNSTASEFLSEARKAIGRSPQ
jgi:hypothetical protein